MGGSVIDVKTRKPVVGATVFINNTTKGSFSDSLGNFIITDVTEDYFDIVVVKKGFETAVYRFTNQQKNKRIRFEMNPDLNDTSSKPAAIPSVDNDEWLKVFANSFLNNTENALACYIANPGVLKFMYKDHDRQLFVTSTEPLQIFNESLGYMIFCDLEEYIMSANVGPISTCYFWFKELSTKRKEIAAKWSQNRINTYKGSLLHFMQAFYSGALTNAGFKVSSVNRIYEDEQPFDFKYAVKKNKLLISEEKNKTGNDNVLRRYVDVLAPTPLNKIRIVDSLNHVVYLRSSNQLIVDFYSSRSHNDRDLIVSSLTLKNSDSLRVESNGNFFDSFNVFLHGFWAKQGVEDKLPVDYAIQPLD